jgi:hypothetical protein
MNMPKLYIIAHIIAHVYINEKEKEEEKKYKVIEKIWFGKLSLTCNFVI